VPDAGSECDERYSHAKAPGCQGRAGERGEELGESLEPLSLLSRRRRNKPDSSVGESGVGLDAPVEAGQLVASAGVSAKISHWKKRAATVPASFKQLARCNVCGRSKITFILEMRCSLLCDCVFRRSWSLSARN
jgi:hypothetical protein